MKVPKDVQECFPWVLDIEGLSERDIVRIMSTINYQGYILGKRIAELKAVIIFEFKKLFKDDEEE